jgi:hypothetical protein
MIGKILSHCLDHPDIATIYGLEESLKIGLQIASSESQTKEEATNHERC